MLFYSFIYSYHFLASFYYGGCSLSKEISIFIILGLFILICYSTLFLSVNSTRSITHEKAEFNTYSILISCFSPSNYSVCFLAIEPIFLLILFIKSIPLTFTSLWNCQMQSSYLFLIFWEFKFSNFRFSDILFPIKLHYYSTILMAFLSSQAYFTKEC